MTKSEAANILGVDDDTMEDLEDVIGIEGPWTIADLERAAEILDGDNEDGDEDEDGDGDGDDDPDNDDE